MARPFFTASGALTLVQLVAFVDVKVVEVGDIDWLQ
jgi:hypothetical protein